MSSPGAEFDTRGRPMLSAAFRRRRFLNWFPLGLAYAFLYMGRYSYIPAKSFMKALIDDSGLGTVGLVGAWTYGISFLINGPLTERLGGRFAMLVATAGSAAVNLAIGGVLRLGWTDHFLVTYSVLTAVNMYFQSWAAIAIVKVNGAWFHVRERGAFGGIFGVMISSGLFLAYTVSPVVTKNLFGAAAEYYFLMPGALLLLFFVGTLAFVRDTPEGAGLGPFETGSSDEFDSARKISVVKVFGRLLTHPIVLTIALIEFCTGVLRNGLMYWYPIWSREHSTIPGLADWQGVGLFAAGVFGGLTAGYVSDRIFGSRRGPVAGLLYGVMIVMLGAMVLAMTALDGTDVQSVMVFGVLVAGSFCVIGTHGVLSGTATADFGGKGATAMAVGIIDGFVYLGVGVQSAALGNLTGRSWAWWPLFLLPFAFIGLLLAGRIWNALPKRSGGGGH
ncbi:MAG: MFS transporter [Deltaproteobacteria bacterium]|nr:MFS transporter [Deltaproteobacteria bacterium]